MKKELRAGAGIHHRGQGQTGFRPSQGTVAQRKAVTVSECMTAAGFVKRSFAPAGHCSATPKTVQPKTMTTATARKPPTAPAVYRPQQIPKVLQTKSALPQPSSATKSTLLGRSGPGPATKPAGHNRSAQLPSTPGSPRQRVEALHSRAASVKGGGINRPIVPNRPAAVHKPNVAATLQPKAASWSALSHDRSAAIQLARKGTPTLTPKPDKLEFDESTDATTGMMIVYDRLGNKIVERTFGSGGGQHAEEKAIDHLQHLVNAGTIAPMSQGGNEPYLLFLQLSKSPCSSTSNPATRTDGNLGCMERLHNLMLNGLQNGTGQTVTFQVQIAATKPYQAKGVTGAKDASRNNYKDFGGGADGSGSFGLLRGQ